MSRHPVCGESYWDWSEQIAANADGASLHPATNLLYGLAEAIDMLHEEGLDAVFARHDRHAAQPAARYKPGDLKFVSGTAGFFQFIDAVLLPDGHDADAFRAGVLKKFNMSLGNGLSKLAGKVFRIGHLGDFNDLMLLGTLSGVEMGLSLADIPIKRAG